MIMLQLKIIEKTKPVNQIELVVKITTGLDQDHLVLKAMTTSLDRDPLILKATTASSDRDPLILKVTNQTILNKIHLIDD